VTTGREPDRDLLFLHVFGCPCQYEPSNAVEHKRATMGMVCRPSVANGFDITPLRQQSDINFAKESTLSLKPYHLANYPVPTRKLLVTSICMYAKFDAEHQTRPRIEFKDFTLDRDKVDNAIQRARDTRSRLQHQDEIPDHALSIKVLSDFKRNQRLNKSNIQSIPSSLQDDFNSPQPDPGENCDIPEPLKLTKDLLLE
jgi:hypothetical protein